MNKVHIKECTSDDLELLYFVCRTAYTENFAHHWNEGGLEWYLNKVYSREGIQNDLVNPGLAYYMASIGSEAAGFMKLNLNSKFSESEDGLEVEKIYTRPSYHGTGVGNALMKIALDLARTEKKKFIWLGVIDTNTDAINFYKKSGFKLFDKIKLDLPYFKEELKGMWRMRMDL